MQTKLTLKLIQRAALLLLFSTLNYQLSTHAQGTAFTYQGRLNDGANPATGIYDLRFAIYDSLNAGIQHGGPLTNSTVNISNGLFTVTLDFGAGIFTGPARWLDIAVRTNGGGAFSPLAPRQALSSTPYAVFALGANSVAAANIIGTIPLTHLPATVMTNGASGVSITGTFAGNGAAVTNVNLLNVNANGALSWSTNYPGNFVLAATPVTGANPFSVVAVDVNGDGKLDLITANMDASTLTVLTNNGSGGLVLASVPGVGSGPISLTSGDANGDGKVDLITANFFADTLSVMTNDGSGGFALASSPAVGSQPRSVRAADVNGDGRLDLINVNASANTLSVLTNDSNGGFGRIDYSVGSFPVSVAASDLNGDGKVDLIAANSSASTLSVLTNDGSGGFSPASSPGVGSGPIEVVAADVNGDTKTDLITANSGGNTLSVLTNNGSGGFGLASTLGVGIYPASVAAADVNGDGRTDLISANAGAYPSYLSSLTVLTNNGSGNFVFIASLEVGNLARKVIAADVNGDGRADLINANGGGNNLSVLFNTPVLQGNFTGNGGGLTSLNAANISAGTLADGRLSANVALRAGGNSFTGDQKISGNVGIGTVTPSAPLEVVGEAKATVFTPTSDRHAKENFTTVNPAAVLAKVAALPITEWSYKSMADARHVGPMAQDFHAAFGLGSDDKGISTVDADGVALAAIQGLNQKLLEQSAALKNKDSEIQELRQAVAELQKTVRKITSQTQD